MTIKVEHGTWLFRNNAYTARTIACYISTRKQLTANLFPEFEIDWIKSATATLAVGKLDRSAKK